MSLLTFHFNYLDAANPSVMNCVVVGPQSRKYFQVMPDPRYTIFQNTEGQVAAFIDWSQLHPTIEIRGMVQSQAVGSWIRLSPDRARPSRTMEAGGRCYTWAANGNSTCLYAIGSNANEMFARITREYNTVKLEMTPAAINAGLLERAIVSTVLLQCGRNID